MNYIFSYELASCVVMCLLLVHFIAYKQFPSMRTRLFLVFLIGCILGSAVNLFLGVNNSLGVHIPRHIKHILTFFVFGFQGFNYYMFYYYSLFCCELKAKERKKLAVAGSLPVLFLGILLLLTPFKQFLYFVDANGNIQQGSAHMFVYINDAAYLLMEVVILVLGIKRIRKYTKIVIVIYTILALGALWIELCIPGLMLEGIVHVIILLLLYLSMQNQGEMTDYTSKLGNRKALKSIIRSCMDNRDQISIVYVRISKMNSLRMAMGNKSSHDLTEMLGKFFRECGSKYDSFRVEANEFAIYVPANKKPVSEIVDRINKRFEDVWKVGNMELKLSPEIIVFDYPEHFINLEELWDMRDYMLRYVEEHKQSNVLLADEKLMEAYHKEIKVEQALNKAAKNKSIEVVYQPIYSIKDGFVTGAEALARLRDDNGNYISPMEFIPLAEKSNMIVKLGYIIFEKVCIFIRDEIQTRPELRIARIHVNLSAIQCIQKDMSERFLTIMQEYDVPPGMIEFEVTETITMTFTSLMEEHMDKLTQAGCHFSLDDYGTGSSNCSYLIDFSFRTVKFDKNMMDAYFHSDTAHIIVGNEIATADMLGLDVVAEGIETEEEYQKLLQTKVNYIQGYYFSKPLQPDEFVAYVKNQL